MSEDLTVAFVATGQEWHARWSGHLYDHGPAELVAVIAEARTAFDERWRVVVVDAASTLMDPSFVGQVHDRGRGVLAVWDPNQPGSKQRALDANADDLIPSDAAAMEFVATLVEMADRFTEGVEDDAQRARRRPPVVAKAHTRAGQLIAVGGPIGTNPAPVVLGMARALGRRQEPVIVIDGDEVTPSLAQTLDVAPVPNLITAAAAARTGADMGENLASCDGFYLLPGLAEPGQWAELGVRAAMGVVLSFAARFTRTLVTVSPMIENLGTHTAHRFGISRSVLAEADTIVAIGDASPVGLTRLTLWVAEVRLIAPTTPLYLVGAGSPGDKYRQAEVLARLEDIGRPAATMLLPDDAERVRRAEWQGATLRRGPLVRSVAGMTDTVCPTTTHRRFRR